MEGKKGRNFRGLSGYSSNWAATSVLGRSERNHLLKIVCCLAPAKRSGRKQETEETNRALNKWLETPVQILPTPPHAIPRHQGSRSGSRNRSSNLSPASLVIVLTGLLKSVLQHEIGANSLSFLIVFQIAYTSKPVKLVIHACCHSPSCVCDRCYQVRCHSFSLSLSITINEAPQVVNPYYRILLSKKR